MPRCRRERDRAPFGWGWRVSGREDANLKSLDEQRDYALKNAQEEHDAGMAEIAQESINTENQLDSEAQSKINESQKQLDQAKAEWQQAIAEAAKKRVLHDPEMPERIKPPPGLQDLLEGLGPTLE